MYSIEIDFEVFKEITLRRTSEDVTPNDVLRSLLGLPMKGPVRHSETRGKAPWVTKGVSFPDGTEFRALYKGQTFTAVVNDGALIVNGGRFTSPSSAAGVITRNSVNGWKFWECRFPGENVWKPMIQVRKSSSKDAL